MIPIASDINEKQYISDSTSTRDSIIDRFALERRKRDAEGNIVLLLFHYFFGNTIVIINYVNISFKSINFIDPCTLYNRNFIMFPNENSLTTPDEESSDYTDYSDYSDSSDYSTTEGCQSSAAGKSD